MEKFQCVKLVNQLFADFNNRFPQVFHLMPKKQGDATDFVCLLPHPFIQLLKSELSEIPAASLESKMDLVGLQVAFSVVSTQFYVNNIQVTASPDLNLYLYASQTTCYKPEDGYLIAKVAV